MPTNRLPDFVRGGLCEDCADKSEALFTGFDPVWGGGMSDLMEPRVVPTCMNFQKDGGLDEQS